MANRADIVALFGLLAASWPNYQITEQTIEAYLRILADIPGDVLLAAGDRCLAKCEWWPTIAKVRAEALAFKHQAQGYVSGEIAYLQAQRYYDSGGRDRPTNPFVLQALDAIGGIWAIRTSERPEWTRKGYIDIYNALVEHAKEGGDVLLSERELWRRLSLGRAREEAEALRLGPAPEEEIGA